MGVEVLGSLLPGEGGRTHTSIAIKAGRAVGASALSLTAGSWGMSVRAVDHRGSGCFCLGLFVSGVG